MASYKDLFYLGFIYGKMRELTGREVKLREDQWTVLWLLETFENRLKLLGIENKAISMFIAKTETRLEKYAPNEIIKGEDAAKIESALAGMWDHFVNDILLNRKLLVENQNLVVNPKKLHEGVKGFFTDKQIAKIPDSVKRDLQDGMMALLIGMWTPSVMINLRAVEGVLREYYEKITGENPVVPNGYFLNWGNIIQELSTQSVTEELMVNLNYLKERRNEAQHPGKRFNQTVAESTLLKAIETINAMLQ